MYCHLVKEAQGSKVVGFGMYTRVKVTIARDNAAQRGHSVRFCFFCQVEIISEIDNAGGVGFVKGNAAFVNECRHGENQL